MRKLSHLMLVGLFLVPTACVAGEEEDWIMDTSSIGQDRNGVIRNDQILEMGVPTASALQMEGESSLRLGNVDRALVALQRATELAPLDTDKRILYAECLEKKLMAQKPRDPRLYNFCIKQWLFVATKAEFADQSMQGRAHLGALSGAAPKLFEKPAKFLARVLVPEDGSTKVVIGGPKARAIAEKKTDKDKNKEELQ